MEILSPGGIPDGLTLDEIKNGMTAVRTPQLVHILDKMNYVEDYGTGIDRMLDAYSGTAYQPEFEVAPHMFKVTFPNLNYTISETTNMPDEERVILLLKEKGAISKQDIQKYLDITDYRARNLLNGLRSRDKV